MVRKSETTVPLLVLQKKKLTIHFHLYIFFFINFLYQRPGGLQGGEGGSVAISTSSPQQHWKRCVKFAKLAVRCGATLSPPKSKGNLDMTW